jgi:hypothetical protein
MKQVEYTRALKANDQLHIDLNKADLLLLKEDFAKTVKEFDLVPTDSPHKEAKDLKKTRRWWHSFFNLKPAANRK